MKSPSSSSVAPSRVDMPMTPFPPRRCAFDKTAMGNANDAALICDQVLHVDLGFVRSELGQPRRPMFVANVAQFFFDNREDARFLRKNISQIFDRVYQLFVLIVDLVAFEAGELIKPKIKNLIGLVLAKCIAAFDQTRFIANKNTDLLHLFPRKVERE